MPALRRSAQLSDGHYGHIFVFSIYVSPIVIGPVFLVVDLRSRREAALTPGLAGGPGLAVGGSQKPGHSLDPRRYSDEDGPKVGMSTRIRPPR